MDWAAIASEFLRALRGEVGQLALSRDLGYRSNVVSTWETGRRIPTAAEALRVARAVGIAPAPRLQKFMRLHPEWIAAQTTWEGRDFVAGMLDTLRAETPVAELSRTVGRSRFAVARILHGECEPRLPEFFRLVEATTYRVIDLIAEFVDPERMPSLAEPWAALQALRRLAYDRPVSEAVRCALELDAYRGLPAHEPGWLAARLGISLEEEEQVLETLVASGVVQERGGRLEMAPGRVVDTGRDPSAVRAAKNFWSREAGRRGLVAEGMHSYLVFTTDEALLQEIRQLQLDHYSRLRTLISSRPEADRVCLLSLQLTPLDAGTSE